MGLRISGERLQLPMVVGIAEQNWARSIETWPGKRASTNINRHMSADNGLARKTLSMH